MMVALSKSESSFVLETFPDIKSYFQLQVKNTHYKHINKHRLILSHLSHFTNSSEEHGCSSAELTLKKREDAASQPSCSST